MSRQIKSLTEAELQALAEELKINAVVFQVARKWTESMYGPYKPGQLAELPRGRVEAAIKDAAMEAIRAWIAAAPPK